MDFTIKEAYKKVPDKIIQLTPELVINWIFDKSKLPIKRIGFKINIDKEIE
jgi:hypothetical protein